MGHSTSSDVTNIRLSEPDNGTVIGDVCITSRGKGSDVEDPVASNNDPVAELAE